MAIVDLSCLKDHLSLLEEIDDPIVERMGWAAQAHIERLLGYKIETRYGGEGQEPVPEDLQQAVLMLAAWWYEVRETVSEGAREVPFGVREIVSEYREFTF